jgi:MFS family permease
MEALTYNTAEILKSFGFEVVSSTNLATTCIGVAPILAAFAGALAFDRIGRRACVLTSLVLTFLSLGVLRTMLVLKLEQPVLSVFFLCAVSFAVDFGFGPGKLIIGTESYPVAIRAKGLALGLFVNRLLSGVITFAFPVAWHYIGLDGLLTIFTSVSFAGIIWAWCHVPEAVGLSLEDVSRLYYQPIRRPSWTLENIEDSQETSVVVLRAKAKAYGTADIEKYAEVAY